MPFKAEQDLARLLRAALAGRENGESFVSADQFQSILDNLECFVEANWHHESLDGIYPVLARKTGPDEAEVFGQCLLLADQCATPFYARLKMSPVADRIVWAECRLGEFDGSAMVRVPYEQLISGSKRLYQRDTDPDQIDWIYRYKFGGRLQN